MRKNSHLERWLTAGLLAGLLLPAVSCGGGGGAKTTPVTINSINLSPGTPAGGTVVTLSASLLGATGAVTKDWSVSNGTLSTTVPGFSLILRDTARARGVSAASISTAQDNVYWVVPASAGSATITLTIGAATKTRNVTFGASPVTLSVADGANGAKICTISASAVDDLYQAAFRINYSSAWQPADAQPGDFLGAESDILFFSKLNVPGFVPVAITRKGGAAGIDGSGLLATLTFAQVGGVSSVERETSDAAMPFDLGLVVLRNSQDQPIR